MPNKCKHGKVFNDDEECEDCIEEECEEEFIGMLDGIKDDDDQAYEEHVDRCMEEGRDWREPWAR